MTMTQRYVGSMERIAGKMDQVSLSLEAKVIRLAAQHMQALQSAIDSPWKPMKSAPTDGAVVLVLLEGSDIPHAARWLSGHDDQYATEMTDGPGWHLAWDGWPVPAHDGPLWWMPCPKKSNVQSEDCRNG